MPDDKAIEVLKKELRFEIIPDRVGIGELIVSAVTNNGHWIQWPEASLNLWQAALSREKKIQADLESRKALEDYAKGLEKQLEEEKERCAKICDSVDGFTMSGTPEMRKYYKMGAEDCAEAIRTSKDVEQLAQGEKK